MNILAQSAGAVAKALARFFLGEAQIEAAEDFVFEGAVLAVSAEF